MSEDIIPTVSELPSEQRAQLKGGEPRFTKGPWTLTHISGSNFAVQEFGIRGMFGTKPNVYPIFNRNSAAIDGASVHCSPANAHLMSAAPDLYEAAKLLEDAEAARDECEYCADALQMAPETCERCFPAFDAARVTRRVALAKARGETP